MGANIPMVEKDILIRRPEVVFGILQNHLGDILEFSRAVNGRYLDQQ